MLVGVGWGRPKYATGEVQRQKRLHRSHHRLGLMRLVAPTGPWPVRPTTRQRPMASGEHCQVCSEQSVTFPSPKTPGPLERTNLWKKPHETGENPNKVGESPESSEKMISAESIGSKNEMRQQGQSPLRSRLSRQDAAG